MSGRVILVVEDGTEYIDAFRMVAGVELLLASGAADARRILTERRVDAVFLDVVFDRIPATRLAGRGAVAYLARRQGFYIASEIAPLVPPGAPILIAHDFTSEPDRLAALRAGVPGLEGIAEGVAISRILERLLGGPPLPQGSGE